MSIKTWHERCEEQHGDLEIVTHEMVQARMSEEIDDLRDEIDRLRAEVAHWKSNHDQMAERNAIFRQRPDLPADRIEMAKRLDELRAECEGLRADLEKQYAVTNEYMLDAERYRWVRQAGAWESEVYLDGMSSDQYDAAVDAMRLSGEPK